MSEEKEGYRVLNRDVIKYIAMFTMLLNHISHMLPKEEMFLSELFVDVGYFTAITMCYFMVEGYRYTRSKKRYGRRLLLFAIISQFPYSLVFGIENGFSMIYTLFLCFMILVVREKVTNEILKNGLVLALALATCVGDWPILAAIFVILFDMAGADKKKFWYAYVVGMLGIGSMKFMVGYISLEYSIPKSLLYAAGGSLGVLSSGLIIRYLYNGKRATHGQAISKWFFYIFYPAHLLVLGIIDRMM